MNVCIVAGERSGDLHGAALVRAWRERHPEAKFWGMGGEALRRAGVTTVVDSDSVGGAHGFIELWGKLGGLLKARGTLIEGCRRERPDVLILIDFPDFNFSLMRAVRSVVGRVFYFIPPQVWAWRQGRVATLRRYVDQCACIFPFEERFLTERGVRARYVGHPFLDRAPLALSHAELCAHWGVDPGRDTVVVMPGSRGAEISLHGSLTRQVIHSLQERYPQLQCVVPVPTSLTLEVVTREIPLTAGVIVRHGDAREALAIARAALIKSGTSTMEGLFAGVPFAVMYRLKALSWFIARNLVTGVQHAAMPNLIAGREVVREFIQDQAQPEAIVAELATLNEGGARRDAVTSGLREVLDRVRAGLPPGGSAAERAVAVFSEAH